METNGASRVHRRDQAAAALDEVATAERRADHHSTYPAWFWIVTTLGFAVLPSSTVVGDARDLVALLAGAAIAGACLMAERRRRVRDRCVSLGPRGWARELAVFGPAIAVILVAVTVADHSPSLWVTLVAAAAAAAAWLLAGVLSGRVARWTR